MYKRNAVFIAKLNNSPRNKILDKVKVSSSKTRTTLILPLGTITKMKELLTILITFSSTLAFGQNIFLPNKDIWYAVEYKTDSIMVNDTILISVTGNPWRISPDNQKEIVIIYDHDNFDASIFANQSSIGWVTTDTTGAVDDRKTCWFHPPRHNQYKLLELAPFPRVEYPLEQGKTYSKILFIGDGWGDISNTKVYWRYEVIGMVDDLWAVSAKATPEDKPTEVNQLDFTFDKTEGFITLHYKFSNGTIIKFKRIKTRYPTNNIRH